MGRRLGDPVAQLRAGRSWLRSRGPVTLAAAILLEISAATPQSGTSAVRLLRAALLVLVLLGVLLAAAVDGLVTEVAVRARRGWASSARWSRANLLGLPVPLELSGSALLDRSGRPLRGAVRAARIAALGREQAALVRSRSLRGRTERAMARLRALARPYARLIAARAAQFEARVLSARATLLAETQAALLWARPRATRALATLSARASDLWRSVVSRAAGAAVSLQPLRARLRQQGAALAARSAVALRQGTRVAAATVARSRAGVSAVPVPSVPLPGMSLRTLRVVTVGLLLSFVFATAIGTTGLIATRGSVALGASTTLAIISGEVSVLEPGAADFRPAIDGDILEAGATIKTGPESYAILTYFEGSTVSIDPDTVLVIEALQANPDGSTIIGMRQDVGRTWHAVTKLLTAGSKYEVRTPTATATVRGTLFLVGVRAATDLGLPETTIETTEGAVAAERAPTAEEPEGEEIIVPAGFQVKAVQAAPIPPPVPAPEPERKVTVTVGAGNSVVLDPQGRANGEVNGRIVVQTPGATVEKVDGKVVVTLPNTSDGKISTIIQPPAEPDVAAPAPLPVQVITVVSERGKGDSRTEETVQQTVGAPTVTGVEVKKGADESAPPGLRRLDESEKKDAPKVKVAEAPAEEVRALVSRQTGPPAATGDRGASGQGQGGPAGQAGDPARATPSPQGIVNAIVTLTLPPLSREEIARREEQQRQNEEREKRENERREERRREEEQQKIEELRRKEGQARANADRIGGERQQEEGRRDVRRELEDRAKEERRQEEQSREQPPAPVAVIQQIVQAITPQTDNTRREEDKRVGDLRKAEEDATKEAEKAAEERRRAERRQREDSIKAEEQKRKEAEKRAEELRKAEEKAKEEAAKRDEEMRKIEEKAREQAAKLADEQRKQAEKLLEEFRKAEEKARERAAKQLEEQRKAEEKAREESERKLRELRREEEQARERERERERERDQERDEERRERGGGFVPRVELPPAPGVSGRSVEDNDRSQRPGPSEQDGAGRAKKDS